MRHPFRARLALELLETRLAPANVPVLTGHYDALLSGSNTQETTLTPTNVNATNFGRLFNYAVDGYVYAQPLYVPNLAIAGGTHNVVFAATEHDSVYAFDADGGGQLWRRSFINPGSGVTSVPQPDVISGDIVPEIGITGTPVIDATNTMYVVVKTKEVVAGTAHYVQRLHALDITTGLNRATNGVITIGDTTIGGPDGNYTDTTPIFVPGTGAGSDGTTLRFNALRENQRTALTLAGGLVYLSWASHGDNGPYHGWVVGYQASNLSLQKLFNTAPNGSASGIWESGGGLGVDAAGNLYFATGNGFSQGGHLGFDPSIGSYSETVMKLSTTGQLTVADYFTPTDWQTLDQNDADLGSGGTLLLPDAVGSAAHPHLIIETGKTGRMYLMDQGHLGGNNTPGPDLNLQTVSLGGPGVWGNAAFFLDQPANHSGLIYYWGTSVPAKAFRITNGVVNPNPVSQTNFAIGFPGAQPSISANGTDGNTAIMWALRVDNFGQNGAEELMAFKAEDLSQQIYSSNGTGLRDRFGNSVKFVFPIVSNGKVFAGSNGFLSVFGLFPAVTAAPNAPSNLNGTAVQGGTQIQLTWTNPTGGQPATGIKILRSTDGVTFTQVNTVARDVSAYTDTGLTPATLYHYRVVATNQAGDSAPSNTLDIRTRIAAPVLSIDDICPGPSTSGISLRWTVTANDHYDVFRGDANGANFTLIATVPASQTTFTDTGADIGGLPFGTYTYQVVASSSFPEGTTDSAASNVARATIGPINIDHGAPNGNPGFTDHSDLQANGSAQFTVENLLRLTNNFGQAGSAFTVQQVGIRGFTTTFQFRLHEGTQPNPADGLTFTLQGNSPTALGFGGGALGYQGIGRSVAVKFDIWNNEGETDNSTGLFFNGDPPTVPHAPGEVNIPLAANNVNLRSQSTKTITLTYNGVNHTLIETIHDPTPGQINNGNFTTTYNVDIAARLGLDSAYAGFTGGTGGAFVLQDVLNWRYNEQEGNLPPRAPTNLRVVQVDRHDHNRSNITIAWNCNNAYTAQGFVVEESPDGVNWSPIDQVDAGTTTDTFVKQGAGVYYYRVRSFNDLGLSQPSNVTSVDIAGGDHPFDLTFPNFNNHSFLTANGSATFAGSTYRLDDRSSEENFNNSEGDETEDNWVANSFQIAAGAQTLTSLSFLLSGNYTNRAITALIYTGTSLTDPHAGSGLTLVSQTDTTFSGTSGTFVTIPLAAPLTLPVGQVYWAALLMRGVPGNQFPFNEDRDNPLGRSWFDVGPTQGGAYNVNNTSNARVFGATNHPVVHGLIQDSGNLMLRVNATDPAQPLVARLTDGDFGEAGNIFTNNAISFNDFTTSFTYKESPQVGAADGLTFIMQADTRGAHALGGAGGGLGYTGIANSIAIKFDIWNLASHRSSTGIYFDGEPPDSVAGRARSIFMDTDPSNVINFNSGHVFRIDFAYDSTALVLTETVTDTVTHAVFTTGYNVDIAAHLGSNVGYVGFGGGTGGETAVQDVLTWTYHSGPAGGDDSSPAAPGAGDGPAAVIAPIPGIDPSVVHGTPNSPVSSGSSLRSGALTGDQLIPRADAIAQLFSLPRPSWDAPVTGFDRHPRRDADPGAVDETLGGADVF
jgi:hypothetical protein